MKRKAISLFLVLATAMCLMLGGCGKTKNPDSSGAGGGGFFLCLTKEADQIEEGKRRLSVISGAEEMMFMRAQINMQGLQVTVGDEELGNPLVK